MIEINIILKELEYLPKYEEQILLQKNSTINNLEDGTGSWLHSKNPPDEREFVIPVYDNLEYTNSILKSLGMCRTRVMKLKSKTCYSYHRDPCKRIHIPLVTNENCFFVIDDEVIRLPVDGNYYIIDTRKKHTFINASKDDRIHIVGSLYDK